MNLYIQGLFDQVLAEFNNRLQEVCELITQQFLDEQKCIIDCLSTFSTRCNQIISQRQAEICFTKRAKLNDILNETVDTALSLDLDDVVFVEKEQAFSCKLCRKAHNDSQCAYCFECAKDLGKLIRCRRCKVSVINKKGRCRECNLIVS